MSAIIINKASAWFGDPAPPHTLIQNVSCFLTAFEITPSTEDVDVGVMCSPGLTDQGITTFTAVASFLWEPALYTALEPLIGDLLWFVCVPDSVNYPNDVIEFQTRFASQPWGRFEVGQRVEVELPLAVLNTPTWRAV